VLLVLIFTVIFVVLVVVYALYSFLRSSGITDIAGVHVTNNLKEAAYQMEEGKKISEIGAEPGYENWLTYRGEKYEFMYPADWELKKEEIVSVRKYNRKTYGYFDSLGVVVEFKERDNVENLSLEDFARINLKSSKKLIPAQINGISILRTGKILLNNGMYSESVYCQLNNKILEVRAVYYNKDTSGEDENVEKIFSSLKLL